MGGDPSHWDVLEGVPPSSHKADNWEAPTVIIQWELAVTPILGSNVRSGLGGDRNLHIKNTEHVGTVHRD